MPKTMLEALTNSELEDRYFELCETKTDSPELVAVVAEIQKREDEQTAYALADCEHGVIRRTCTACRN